MPENRKFKYHHLLEELRSLSKEELDQDVTMLFDGEFWPITTIIMFNTQHIHGSPIDPGHWFMA